MSADQTAPKADPSAADTEGAAPNPDQADPEASFLDDPDLPDAVKRALRDSGQAS